MKSHRVVPRSTAFGEFTPRWREAPFDTALLAKLGQDFSPEQDPLADPPPGVQVTAARVRSGAWDLTLASARPATIALHLLYYPRWQAKLDGSPLALRPQPGTGYVQLDVPAGSHRVALRYAGTPTETVGLAISGLTLLALLVAGIMGYVRRGRRAAQALGTSDAARAARGVPGASFDGLAPCRCGSW